MNLPIPNCTYGYTSDKVKEIMGARIDEFYDWMNGQTMVLCHGEDSKCAHKPNASVVFSDDIRRFVNKLPVID